MRATPAAPSAAASPALDVTTGAVLWHGYAIGEALQSTTKSAAGVQLWGPSGAAIWSLPTIDLKQQIVYATMGDSYSDPPGDGAFVAFRMATASRHGCAR